MLCLVPSHLKIYAKGNTVMPLMIIANQIDRWCLNLQILHLIISDHLCSNSHLAYNAAN